MEKKVEEETPACWLSCPYYVQLNTAKWHSYTPKGLEIETYLQGHHKTLHVKVVLD